MRTLFRWVQHVESRHMRYWDILPAWYQDRMGWYDLRTKRDEDRYGVIPDTSPFQRDVPPGIRGMR